MHRLLWLLTALLVSAPVSAQVRVNGGQDENLEDVTVTSLGSIGLVTFTRAGIGVTPTDGLIITNTTAAAAGAQQISPRLRFRGSGWKTDATAASQTIDYAAYVLPVQGAAAPSGNLLWRVSIDGGAYTTIGTLSSNGAYTSPNTLTGNAIASTVGYYQGASFVEMIAVGTPAVSSCGDGALATGSTDSFGRVNSTNATACTITFSNALGTNGASCIVENITANRGNVSAVSTSAFTVSNLTANDDFTYICFGY